MKTKKQKPIEPRIALCYVRQSVTRDADDKNSPDRQKANIKQVCEKHDWVPEWYEDTDGHKSGRHIKNRPGWLALKERLPDADVVALVANDLARLHRKGWRVGDLLDQLEKYDVALALCAPGREVDTSTALGKIFIQFTAMFDEYYAEDISQRAKDSVAYRKSQGKTVGLPPFGTIRDDNGYLIPSPEGAWLMTDGVWVSGVETEPPSEDATWRGYYQAVEYILKVYSEGQNGTERLAYMMQEEGWAFRGRDGNPKRFDGDAVRRIIACWGVYGGIMTSSRGKDLPAYIQTDVDKIVFDEERAVLPIQLLREVARVRQERSVKPVDHGKKLQTRFYPLSRITYCAHCEKLAEEQNDPKLRSPLNGVDMRGTIRYRHKSGVKCGCKAKSTLAHDLEAEFVELIEQFVVDDEKLLEEMSLLAKRTEWLLQHSNEDPELEKTEAIAMCRKRINAAVQLFGDGFIDVDEYKRRVNHNKREISQWELITTDAEQTAMELAMCMDVVDKMTTLWMTADDEDRQGMARQLFTHIIYDLDEGRITDYKLKPWAERYLRLRMSMHEPLGENKNVAGFQALQHEVPPTGLETPSCCTLRVAIDYSLFRVYYNKPRKNVATIQRQKRNESILLQYQNGYTISELANLYDLSNARIHQILHT